MASVPHDVLVLRSPAQIRAVTPPVRAEILERLTRSGDQSIAELAAAMGQRANAVTYHVRRLVAAGVLITVAQRKTPGRSEAVFRLAKPRIGIAAHAGSSSHARLVVGGITAALRLAERELVDAIATGALRRDAGEARPGRRYRARLSPADLAAVQRKLGEIERIFISGTSRTRGTSRTPAPGESLFSFTYLLVPVRDRALEARRG